MRYIGFYDFHFEFALKSLQDLRKILSDFRNKFGIDKVVEKYGSLGIKAITLRDKEYPERLKEIYNPPFVLFNQYNFGAWQRESNLGIGY